MAWDFSTEPEFQTQLDWIRDFVDNTIIPLDLLCEGLDQAQLGREELVLRERADGKRVIQLLPIDD